MSQHLRAKLYINMTSGVSEILSTQVESTFFQAMPHVGLQFCTLPLAQVLPSLFDGEIDLAIGVAPSTLPSEMFRHAPILTYSMIAMSKNRVVGNHYTVNLISEHPWLVHSPDDYSSQQTIETLCRHGVASDNIEIVATKKEMLSRLSHGDFLGLGPLPLYADALQDGIVENLCPGAPLAWKTISIISSRDSLPLSPASDCLRDCLTRAAKPYILLEKSAGFQISYPFHTDVLSRQRHGS